MKATTKLEMKCLVGSGAGIYVPMCFASNYEMKAWGVSEENQEILKNPDHDLYWDTWDDVLNLASFTDDKGQKWSLHQDEDLFAVPDGYEWPED